MAANTATGSPAASSPSGNVDRGSPSFHALRAAACAIVVGASPLLFILNAHGDELHFCHGAWLNRHGQAPYVDFLFHNTPGVFPLLSIPAYLGADLGPWVVVWGRALCALSLWLTAGLLVQLGRLIADRAAGYVSVILFVPLVAVPTRAATFNLPHWIVRPEVLAMPMALYGVYATLSCLTEQRGRQTFARGLLPSGAMSVAVFVSPRMAYLCFALALLVACHRRAVSRRALAGMLVGASMAFFMYGALIGPSITYSWIFQYATFPLPGQTLLAVLRQRIAKFILVASLVQGAYYAARGWQEPLGMLSTILVVMLLGTALERRPDFATWQVSLPFAVLVFAHAVCALWQSGQASRRFVALALVGIGWAYPLRGASAIPYALAHRNVWLSRQLSVFDEFCRSLTDESVLWNGRSHPIAVRDASYLWVQYQYVRRAMAASGITTPRPDIVADCEHHRPALVWHEALYAVADDNGVGRMTEFLATNYTFHSLGFFVRNDLVGTLRPLLDRDDAQFFILIGRAVESDPRFDGLLPPSGSAACAKDRIRLTHVQWLTNSADGP